MVDFWTENGEFRTEKIDLPRHVHTCTVRVHGAGEHRQVPFTKIATVTIYLDTMALAPT